MGTSFGGGTIQCITERGRKPSPTPASLLDTRWKRQGAAGWPHPRPRPRHSRQRSKPRHGCRARFEQRPKPVWEGGGKKKQLSWPSPRGPCHLPSPIRPPVLHPCPRGPRAFALAHSAWSVLAPDLHRRAPLNPKASSLPPAKAPSHSPCLGASYQQTKPSSS